MREIPVVKKCGGLNNRIDPVSDAPHRYLAECTNMLITDDNRLEVAPSFSTLVGTYPGHSMFCNKGDAFLVQDRVDDAAIMRVNLDFSLGGVRSGLTKGNRVAFCQVGAQTLYANGVTAGVIENGASSAWPDQTEHVGANTTRVFYPFPTGAVHLEYWLGRVWAAVGSVIYVSEEYAIGKFNFKKRNFPFGHDVVMMKAVEGGMWVSTTEEIGFIERADTFAALKWVPKSARRPAHEWSASHELVDLSNTKLQIPGQSAVWSSDDGLCVGTQDGQLVVDTENRLIYPTGAMGATVVNNGKCFNSIW